MMDQNAKTELLIELEADMFAVLIPISQSRFQYASDALLRQMELLVEKVRFAEANQVQVGHFLELMIDIWKRVGWAKNLVEYMAYKKVSPQLMPLLKARWKAEEDRIFRIEIEYVVKVYLDNAWEDGVVDFPDHQNMIRMRWDKDFFKER